MATRLRSYVPARLLNYTLFSLLCLAYCFYIDIFVTAPAFPLFEEMFGVAAYSVVKRTSKRPYINMHMKIVF